MNKRTTLTVMKTTKVLIVDDHAIVRGGIRTLIDGADDLTVVGEAATVEEAVTQTGLHDPNVVLMDVQLREGSGVDACRRIRERFPDVKVLMLTSFADDDALHGAILAGASGYILKRINPDELLAGIRTVAGGGSLLDPALVEKVFRRLRGEVVDDPLVADLTEREHEVMALVAEGLSNREIAERMFLAEKTIKNYVSTLLTKLGMSRRTEVVAFAARRQSQSLPKASWDE